ncbi:formate dehydrogenase accessory sulfurtransferase FdhD [Devosia albogilva]|uniref:Sulfur carrier protein FdhD n=1 Tax=Devosia albogilva TaxID=429726 RepID=A0ABW5QJR2_9HYPH
METAFPVLHDVRPLRVREQAELHQRAVPEEQPVAIVCNGTTLAVMMATPADLEDFGVGYLISEAIVDSSADVERSEVVAHQQGIEIRHWISPAKAQRMLARRRQMVGPTGCGLCGIESLEQAMRDLPPVRSSLRVQAAALRQAVADLRALQVLNASTRGVHAAALWHPEQGHRLVREDVGRHNALDKLIGAMATTGTPPGVLLLTSRVSIDLIQKAALAAFPIIAAISVPTNRAIEAAESAGITLVGVARDDGFEIFSHPGRIAGC